MEKNMHQYQGQKQNSGANKPEGKISVDYIPDNKKKSGKDDNDDGEYVDFEEIK